MKSVRLPPKSPNLNAYAERFVLSIKSECLGRMVLVGERYLLRVMNEYIVHDYVERTHLCMRTQLIHGFQMLCWTIPPRNGISYVG